MDLDKMKHDQRRWFYRLLFCELHFHTIKSLVEGPTNICNFKKYSKDSSDRKVNTKF